LHFLRYKLSLVLSGNFSYAVFSSEIFLEVGQQEYVFPLKPSTHRLLTVVCEL